jgi:lipopolysaccharide export system permease protein
MAALLAGEFNRRGQTRRVLVAIACVAALEGVSLALHDLASRSSAAVPARYAVVLVTAALSVYVLLHRPARRGTRQSLGEASA